jgi:hypothetical protein
MAPAQNEIAVGAELPSCTGYHYLHLYFPPAIFFNYYQNRRKKKEKSSYTHQ